MHISYEAGILEDPGTVPPKRMWLMTTGIKDFMQYSVDQTKFLDPVEAPNEVEYVDIDFKAGLPISINIGGKTITGEFEMFQQLNIVAGKHGVGRLDIVESRFVGMKSRGCYETPAGTLLLTAHRGKCKVYRYKSVKRYI